MMIVVEEMHILMKQKNVEALIVHAPPVVTVGNIQNLTFYFYYKIDGFLKY